MVGLSIKFAVMELVLGQQGHEIEMKWEEIWRSIRENLGSTLFFFLFNQPTQSTPLVSEVVFSDSLAVYNPVLITSCALLNAGHPFLSTAQFPFFLPIPALFPAVTPGHSFLNIVQEDTYMDLRGNDFSCSSCQTLTLTAFNHTHVSCRSFEQRIKGKNVIQHSWYPGMCRTVGIQSVYCGPHTRQTGG